MAKCKNCDDRFNIVYGWRTEFRSELNKFVKNYVRDNERTHTEYVALPERIFAVADALGELATDQKIIVLTTCFKEKVTPDHIEQMKSWTNQTQRMAINKIKDEYKLNKGEMN